VPTIGPSYQVDRAKPGNYLVRHRPDPAFSVNSAQISIFHAPSLAGDPGHPLSMVKNNSKYFSGL
jgi:hypothetical protein